MKTRFIALGLLFTGYAQADCAKDYCWPVKVDQLQPQVASAKAYISTDADESLLQSCTPAAGKFLTLDTSKPGGRDVYSTLLAALAADKTVSLVPVKDSVGCEIAYVQIFN